MAVCATSHFAIVVILEIGTHQAHIHIHTHSHARQSARSHVQNQCIWIIYRYANNNNNNNNNEALKKNRPGDRATSIPSTLCVNVNVFAGYVDIVFCHIHTPIHHSLSWCEYGVTHVTLSRMYYAHILCVCVCVFTRMMMLNNDLFRSFIHSLVRCFVRSLAHSVRSFVYSECSPRLLYRSIIWLLLFSLNVNVIMCWRLFVFSLGKLKYS